MKTIHDSNPEFSMTYTDVGVSVTLSAKVLTQDYPWSHDSCQENQEQIGILCAQSAQELAPQAASQVLKFHSEFQEALAKAYCDLIRSRHTSEKNIDLSTNNTSQPSDEKS